MRLDLGLCLTEQIATKFWIGKGVRHWDLEIYFIKWFSHLI